MAEQKKMSFKQQVATLPANFWYANFMEILERLAFFGVRAIAPLFLVKAAEQNGLGLDFAAKGNIYGIWALLQCLIPMVSGGYTERYGYRKSLAVAFTLNIIGYLGMAQSLNLATMMGGGSAGYWIFLVSACFVATGTAIFKPPCHGTIAKTTTEETSSMGWGLFYWVVNIGGAVAPMAAAVLRGEVDWSYVFYGAAIVTACNFIPAFTLYKEPAREITGEDLAKGPVAVFASSIGTIFKDMRLVVFLLIFSCFWLMFLQIWDLMPNFIDEWVDTSDVAPMFGAISDSWVAKSGQVKPEMIININPLSVILLVIPISALISKINKVAAMVIGMMISMVGFVGAGITDAGMIACIMILVFSVGEMTCSPTFSAYVGLIAPPDKKAQYMGYSNIPFAIGWAAGSKIGGNMYEAMASKFKLARRYMVDELKMSAADVMDKEKLPNEKVMEKMAASMDGGTVESATKLLWHKHNPKQIWYYLGVIGLIGTIGMIIFYFATRNSSDQAEQADSDSQ